jgi:hypothetical protein
MAFYAMAMGSIAVALDRANQRPGTDLVLKFLEHFAGIRDAIDSQGLWDPGDGMYYDRLLTSSGTAVPVKVRSMVGMIPLLAVGVVDESMLRLSLAVGKQFASLLGARGLADPAKLAEAGLLRGTPGDQRLLLSVAGPDRLPRLLTGCSTRASFCHRMACVPCLPTTASIRTSWMWRGFGRPSTTSRPSPPRPCSAGTPTGGGRCGSH